MRSAAELPLPPARPMSGEYLALHTYLAGRFADTVVLSFAQIESLLGFPLPATAGNDAAWWTAAATAEPRQQDAWRLARRTASPNLTTRVVTFDRAF
jgi:hypothetical protein